MPMACCLRQVRWGTLSLPISSFQFSGMRNRPGGWTASDQNCRAYLSKRQARRKVVLFGLVVRCHCDLWSATLAPPPFFEGESRTAFLRHLHPIFADLPRNHRHVSEVDVNVIVDSDAGVVAVLHHRDVGAEVFGKIVELRDQFLRL